MKMIKISATEARNRFFELIEMVAYKNAPVVVKRNNRDLVRIVAARRVTNGFVDSSKLAKETFAICAKDTWPYEKKAVIKKEKTTNQGW